jgi:glycosyltransferase involved in cell wall biosynthesis
MTALVSIIIPTYNRANDLKRALKSVVEQTHTYWEAVVVDNHSNDNTDDVVKNFHDPRIKLFKIHNQGLIAASRNLGIQNAAGEYVAFLDSDDWWMPEKLEESVKVLRQGFDVIYHDLYTVTKAGQKWFWKKTSSRDVKSPVFDDLVVSGNALSNSSVVVRKYLLMQSGTLPEDKAMNPCCDYAAWLHLAKYTEKFKRIPQTLGYLWIGGGNVTTTERTISSLDRFESLYADDIKDLSRDKVCWFNYAKGRAHYILRSYGMAKENLDQIRYRRAPLFIKLKTYWMLFLINLYQRRVER